MNVDHKRLGFKIQADSKADGLTSHIGVPLVIEYARALGVIPCIAAGDVVPSHPNAYHPANIVEATLAAITAGAKSISDVAWLGRQDIGLRTLLERTRWPSADTLERFLNGAHELPDWQAGVLGAPSNPAESARLQVLDDANHTLVAAVQRQLKLTHATLDHDATLIESSKKQALPHYDSGRGYQPWIAYWYEAGVVIQDEFREGNVSAHSGALAQIQRSFAALPNGVTERYFRADSAMYEQAVLDWLDAQEIGYGISADMSREFRAACEATPEDRWSRLRKLTEHGPIPTDCEIAEIDFQPFGDKYLHREMKPRRYIAIRKRDEQGSLIRKDERTWYLGIVTNRWDEPVDQTWWWHRQKCGSVELVHDEIKNDLAAGVLPCGRLQANAAWFRLNVIAYNILAAMKVIGLPEEMKDYRPATLRYRLLNLAGRVIKTGRHVMLKLPWVGDLLAIYRSCRSAIDRARVRVAAATA